MYENMNEYQLIGEYDQITGEYTHAYEYIPDTYITNDRFHTRTILRRIRFQNGQAVLEHTNNQ